MWFHSLSRVAPPRAKMAVTMLPVLATMVLLDMRELKPGLMLSAADWTKLILLAGVTGLVVAFIEETAMRGIMHSAIARESGPVAAIVLVSLVYAATHFFAKTRIPADQVGPGSGLDMLAGMLDSFSHPLGILDAFLCLFMVGVLLGVVVLKRWAMSGFAIFYLVTLGAIALGYFGIH